MRVKSMRILFWLPFFFVACSSTPPATDKEQKETQAATPAGQRNQDEFLQSQLKRIMSFLKTSGCNFQEKMGKELAQNALWHKNYYCEKTRIYLRLFVFPNQEQAIQYAKGFMKNIQKQEKATQGDSRIELIHSWGVNGSILFIIRADDQQETNHLLSHFSGEE
jgi:hypothetical protein